MKLRRDQPIDVAAARAGMSRATGYRISEDPTLPSQKKGPRGRRRPDPLEAIFESEVVPLLRSASSGSGLSPSLKRCCAGTRAVTRHPAQVGAADPFMAGSARRRTEV